MNLLGDIKPGQDVLVSYTPTSRPATFRPAKIDKVGKLHVVLDNGTRWNRRRNCPANSVGFTSGKLLDPNDPGVQAQQAAAAAEEEQLSDRLEASRLFDRLYRAGHKAADWKAIHAFLAIQKDPAA